jgi:hypothetical protein
MVPFYVNPNNADNTAIGAVSAANSTLSMAADGTYLFLSDCSCYLKQGATPTASAADGSMLVAAGVGLLLQGRNGAKIAVIQSGAAGGNCSLTPIVV